MNLSKVVSTPTKEKALRAYARAGLASYGLVYCIMSALCFMTALGLRRKQSDKDEAFKFIYDQPFGRVMLAVVGFCLLGYVALRLFQAIKDTRHKGRSLKAVINRLNYAFIAVTYLSLSYFSFKLAFDQPDNGDNRTLYISRILKLPYGQWIIGGIALIFAGAACYQIYRGAGRKFMKNVDLRNSDFKKTFTTLGVIGYVARGVVFGCISYLFLKAAIEVDPKEAKGTGGAFKFMQDNFGNILLGVIALGLLAFGFFLFVRAKHEKMSFGLK